MKLSLPVEVCYILERFTKQNYQIFLVGGAVRDLVMGKKLQEIEDYDFTSDASPAEIQALFPESFYENKFGTVSVTLENLLEELAKNYQSPADNLGTLTKKTKPALERIIDLKNASKIHISLQDKAIQSEASTKDRVTNLVQFPPFEITTYRSDGDYTDHRRPESVTFGQSLADDLERRDFTINALAISVEPEVLHKIFADKKLQAIYELTERDFKLIDLHQGQADLNKKIIRTVGKADQRFTEDALRMLRAVRLAVQLDMDIDTDTYYAIKYHKDSLKFVSFERIRDELLKILASANPARGIELLDQTGLLPAIIPELYQGIGMQQRGHHVSDVWTHSLDALRHCPSPDPVVRLATLLHDIGKPLTYKEEKGEITFYSHDILGSRIASKIANRLRLPKKDVQRIFILVRYHMFYYQPEHSDASIRRFIRRVGFDNIDDILDLREGDRLGSGARKTSWRLEEMKQRIIEQLNQPMGLDDLNINGHDLMQELQLKPGPMLGQILDKLLELVLEKPELNKRSQLLEEAKKISEQFR